MSDDAAMAEWIAQTKAVADHLDQLDYFELLGLPADCSADDLKRQYQQLQRNYHPDAFFRHPDQALRAAVMRISKRVSEAYVVLRDPAKRELYAEDIQGPERAKRLRYSDEARRPASGQKRAGGAQTEQGKKLWKKASEAARKGDVDQAIRDLQTALLFEAGNEALEEALEKLKAQKKAASSGSA